jgi:hypothetical protein
VHAQTVDESSPDMILEAYIGKIKILHLTEGVEAQKYIAITQNERF